MRTWLRDIRKKAGMTEWQVAEAVGITQVGYHLIETGERTPRPETAQRIGAVLGFPWTRFFEGEEKNEED